MNWEVCANWFKDNKEILEIISSALAVFLAICTLAKYGFNIFKFLFSFIFDYRNNETLRNAYRDFENATENKKRIIISEPIFFNEPADKKYFFYSGITIIDLHGKQKKIKMKKLLNKSYLIVGEAGSGKSACLKNDFLRLRKKWYLRTCIAQWFLFSDELIGFLESNKKQKDWIEKISQARYKKLFLYIDGIDEIGEEKIDLFYGFVNELAEKYGKNFVLKISSRQQFALNNIYINLSMYIDKYVKVASWDQRALLKYGKALINNLKLEEPYRKSKNDFYILINKSIMREKYITNPLLMKLYIYCCIYGGFDNIDKKIKDRFNLYSSFVTTLIQVYWRRKKSNIPIDSILNEQNEFSERVFYSITVSGKVISNINKLGGVRPLCKTVSNDKVVLIHESFYEYFVARYYYNCTSSRTVNLDSVLVYCRNFPNDYADFITDAFIKDNIEIRKKMARRFIDIYYFTLSSDGKNKYQKLKFSIPSCKLDLEELNEKEFFSLKYELVFRLGRLHIKEKFIVDFLEFIYYHDTNICIEENNEYYIVVLKRCCAISSSLLGKEKIEIDYVQHMLPCDKENYNINYDLANRTHTLIFYGDITGSDIYKFIDDDPKQSCEKAIKKRMDRLSVSLPESVAMMDEREKKYYYFRLFDLATIYTFKENRKFEIGKKDLNIIKGCNVVFGGASDKRTNLMKKIKEQLLKK